MACGSQDMISKRTIVASGVSKNFDTLQVLSNISFDAGEGVSFPEIISLVALDGLWSS